jgi:hypothetical protein
MFLEAASKVTGIFLPSQARLVGKKRDSPPFTSFQGFCAARVTNGIAIERPTGLLDLSKRTGALQCRRLQRGAIF